MYTYLIVDDEMIERKGIRMLLSRMNIRENILLFFFKQKTAYEI